MLKTYVIRLNRVSPPSGRGGRRPVRLLQGGGRHPGQQEPVVAVVCAGPLRHGVRAADAALPGGGRMAGLARTALLLRRSDPINIPWVRPAHRESACWKHCGSISAEM